MLIVVVQPLGRLHMTTAATNAFNGQRSDAMEKVSTQSP